MCIRDSLRLAWLAIVLYPVCVPIVYAVLFWKVRLAVWSRKPTPLSESISFLTEDYDPPFFFWELVESYKKLLLVGAMSIVMEGTINQLIIAFVLVSSFQTALLVAKPYKQTADDVVEMVRTQLSTDDAPDLHHVHSYMEGLERAAATRYVPDEEPVEEPTYMTVTGGSLPNPDVV